MTKSTALHHCFRLLGSDLLGLLECRGNPQILPGLNDVKRAEALECQE